MYDSSSQNLSGSMAAGPQTVASAVRVGQVITFALAQGVILIAAVMFYLAWGGDGPQDDVELAPAAAVTAGMDSQDRLFLLIGLVATVAACLAAVLVPGFIRQQAIDNFQAAGESLPTPLAADTPLTPPAQTLVQAKLTATLVSQAALEGAAVINAVFMLLTSLMVFLLPVAIAIFGIVVQIPTVGKLLDWLDAVRRS